MEEIRLRPRTEKGGGAFTYGVAFVLIAFGVLKIAESLTDRSFEGAGQIIIGGVLFLPSIISVGRGHKPHYLLSIIGVVVIATGVINLISWNIPWFAVLLVLAGLWILLRSRGGGGNYEIAG